MKFFRIILVIFIFFIRAINAVDKDWTMVSIWLLLFIVNILFLVADEIKNNIDEKIKELLKELKNKSDE
jgi:hypothetical protein